MPVRRVAAHAAVKDDAGKWAIERGPLVYCAEGADNGGKVLARVLSRDSRFEAVERPDLLGGIVAVTILPAGKGIPSVPESRIPRSPNRPGKDEAITAIPYCLWENRGPNEMTVWFRTAVQSLPSQREIVQRAMRERPDDPWPRGTAHVVLAVPGSQQPEKGYHEPGGSFSPAVGSFGVSIWVRDSAGNLTGDQRWAAHIKQLRQRFCWPDPKGVPAITTVTPHYEATWACPAIGTATLDLDQRGDPGERLELVVRSVGPAGGPIERIEWNGKRLRINDRWSVSAEPEPKAVFVGHEGDPGWKTAAGTGKPVAGRRRVGLRPDRIGGRPCDQAHVARLAARQADPAALPQPCAPP